MTMILALDSATEQCSAALCIDGKLVSRKSCAVKQHAAEIMGMTDEVVQESGAVLKDVDFIAYGQGPGSFTGVRIAVSAAQGIALGLNKPLVGVSSLAAMALNAARKAGKEYAVSAIDARMGEVYIGIYKLSDKGLEAVCEEQVLKPEQALELIASTLAGRDFAAVGTGMEILAQKGLICELCDEKFPEPWAIIELGDAKFAAEGGVDAEAAQPAYIRNEVTWKKLSEQGKA